MSFSAIQQRGFALPAVAFLVVIVALIIAGLERISSNQVATSTMGLQSVRAYYSAYSGVERVAFHIRDNNACPTDLSDMDVQLSGFEVRLLSCSMDSYQEGTVPDNVNMYEIRVLAAYGGEGQYGNSPDFASRELTVSMMIEQ